MKKNHSSLWLAGAIIFLAAIYSAVLFLLKKTFDFSSWVLYTFTMIAFILLALQVVASSKNSENVAMDASLGLLTVVYFLIQVVLGGIVCMFFTDLPNTSVLVSEIILLGIYLVAAFVMYGAQSHSSAQSANDRRSVNKIRLLENDIQCMAEQAADADVKKALENLAEEIRYSDVANLPGLADVEARIAQNVAVLQEELTDEAANVAERIETIQRLLRERNRTAEILQR